MPNEFAQLLASKTFNTSQGRMLQEAGRKALLAGLPRDLDPEIARRLYARYLDEAPYSLWGVLHKTRREHAEALVAELRKAPSLHATFLLGALPPRAKKLDDAGFERLQRATKALAKLNSFSHSATSQAAAERVAFIAEDEVLADAARRALATQVGKDVGLTELLLYLWLVTIVAQDASKPALAVLKKLAAAVRGTDDARVFARLVGYHVAKRPALKAIAKTL